MLVLCLRKWLSYMLLLSGEETYCFLMFLKPYMNLWCSTNYGKSVYPLSLETFVE